MAAARQNVLVDTAKHRQPRGNCDLVERCPGGRVDRDPLHSRRVLHLDRVEHLIPVILVLPPDTFEKNSVWGTTLSPEPVSQGNTKQVVGKQAPVN